MADTSTWSRHGEDVVPPNHYARIVCESPAEFWLQACESKQPGNETAHLRDLQTKAIGFVDFVREVWVQLPVFTANQVGWGLPEDGDEDKWWIFADACRTPMGRDALFGDHI